MTARPTLLLAFGALTFAFGFTPVAQAQLDLAAVAYVAPDKFKWRDPVKSMTARLAIVRIALIIPTLAFESIIVAGAAHAAELNPAAVIYKLPDQIPWGPVNAAGAQSAVVVVDPSKPGFYMVYNKWTKGNHYSRPHFHPNDRYIVVLQGTWWVGSGPKFDPANTTPMPAGSFVTHFGKQVHWDGAKDEDAVLLIMGEGPATATAAEEK